MQQEASVLGIVELEIPNQVAVPGELLNAATDTRTRAEYAGVADRSGSQQVSVLEERSA
jgi:hypothetical protein